MAPDTGFGNGHRNRNRNRNRCRNRKPETSYGAEIRGRGGVGERERPSPSGGGVILFSRTRVHLPEAAGIAGRGKSDTPAASASGTESRPAASMPKAGAKRLGNREGQDRVRSGPTPSPVTPTLDIALLSLFSHLSI